MAKREGKQEMKTNKVVVNKNDEVYGRFSEDLLAEGTEKDLIFCPMCRGLMLEPIVLPDCGHIFCSGCISLQCSKTSEAKIRGKKKCGLCKKTISCKIETLTASKTIKNSMMMMNIKCCNDKCKKVIKINNIIKHLADECEYEKAACKYCKKEKLKKKMEEHEEECAKVETKCDNCKKVYKMTENHELKCPYTQVDCKHSLTLNCPIRLKRRNMLEHEADDTFHLELALNKTSSNIIGNLVDVLDLPNEDKFWRAEQATFSPGKIRSDLATGSWEPARVIDCDDNRIKIRYIRWTEAYDEWIFVKKETYRIKPFMTSYYKPKTPPYYYSNIMIDEVRKKYETEAYNDEVRYDEDDYSEDDYSDDED